MNSNSNSPAPEKLKYNYIIVGAGTAGCVLAARLSENPENTVCLIEAGDSEQHPYIRIPAGVGAAIMSEKFSWNLMSSPQKALSGRQLPLPRGRVLGGSGSINGMAYFRGNAKDYDDWSKSGNKGWSYSEILPYFLRSEHNPAHAGSPYHNTGGPMGVSYISKPNMMCEAFNVGMNKLGFDYCSDFNTAEPSGYGYRQGTIWKGRRVSTASAYLRPVLDRPNLTVMLNTTTRKIVLEGRVARGVEIQTANGFRNLIANKEVIVCGGAFHSPHILLNSGIGEQKELAAVGVECRHHLPGVGKNLTDHPATFIAMDMKDSTSYGLSWKTLPRAIYNGLQYLFARKGPLASNLFETNAYIKTLPDLDRPDMQIVFQPARRNIKFFPIPLGHGFAISVVCLYPQSRGSVKLSSHNPLDPPTIDPALGTAKADVQTLVRGLKLARDIIKQDSFATYQAWERLPGTEVTSDEQLEGYVRSTMATVHHPGSTCRMGNDNLAVVNEKLKVHGIQNLRVADASIYPCLVGANTNASVVVIAEKAADMILGIEAPIPLTARRDCDKITF